MRRAGAVIWTAAVLVLAAARPGAHHSFAAEFDARRPVTLEGVVAVVEWVNPHSWLWIDVTEAPGISRRWGLELPPPNGLLRRGVRRTMLLPGDRVSVQAFPAIDGRLVGSAQSLTLASGTQVPLGPYDPDRPVPAVSPRSPAGAAR